MGTIRAAPQNNCDDAKVNVLLSFGRLRTLRVLSHWCFHLSLLLKGLFHVLCTGGGFHCLHVHDIIYVYDVSFCLHSLVIFKPTLISFLSTHKLESCPLSMHVAHKLVLCTLLNIRLTRRMVSRSNKNSPFLAI